MLLLNLVIGGLVLEKISLTIFSLPSLDSVKSFELYCPERIVGFYEKLGFTASESKLMRKKIS